MLQHFSILIFVALISSSIAHPCLGEYEYCPNTGDCALITEHCGRCSSGQFLCPDTVTCVPNAESFVKCPVKGTHYDWRLSIEQRLDYLVAHTSLADKVSQLQNDAPALPNVSIPRYNWLNEAIHGIAALPPSSKVAGFRDVGAATSFPDGCGLGATWSLDALRTVGSVIGIEGRAKHNSFVRSGNRVDQMGLTYYTPNMNLVRDPRWGRAMEVYSEDPHLTSRLLVDYINGMQKGADNQHMMAGSCCKHYAAYDLEILPNGTHRYEFNAEINARDFWEHQMPAFRTCILEAQASSVMCSYNKINGIPTCGDDNLMNGILRNQWAWDGFVMSDYDAIANMKDTHHYVKTYLEATTLAMNAGCDQEGGGDKNKNLVKAVQQGLVNVSTIETAFRRLFRIRMLLGMLDPPTHVTYNYLTNSSAIVESVEHTEMARNVAQQSICLYKNERNVLPVDPSSVKSVAVIGPEAVQKMHLLGNYNGYPTEIVSILSGIQQVLNYSSDAAECVGIHSDTAYVDISSTPASVVVDDLQSCCEACYASPDCVYWTYLDNQWNNGQGYCYFAKSDRRTYKFASAISGAVSSNNRVPVYYAPGCSLASCANQSQFLNAMQVAAKADVVFVVFGLSPDIENEGVDRQTLVLPGMQPQLLTALRSAVGPATPLIGVMLHGGSIALQGADENLDALIDAWYPGMQGGNAIADVLFGAYNPGGRTPQTWYESDSQLPARDVMDMHALNGQTYRYFSGNVVYPFGYGLSYTTFAYSSLLVSDDKYAPCDPIQLSVTVTNTGSMDGDEVVQVYMKMPDATVPTTRVRLVAFERVHVLAGESTVVRLTIYPRDQYVVYDGDDFYDSNRVVIEQGRRDIFVGGGQPDFIDNELNVSVIVTDTEKLNVCDPPAKK